MANKKKTKKNQVKTTSNKGSAPKEKQVNQILAVCLFAVSVLVFAFSVYKGARVWALLHNFVLGLFGVFSIILPVFIVVATVLYSMGKLVGILKVRVIESGIFLWVLSSAIDIFTTNSMTSYLDHLLGVYDAHSFSNAGVFGAILGNAIYQLFDKTGAIIFIVVLLLAMFMLLTGTSVARLYKGAAVPVKKIGKKAEETLAEVREEKRKMYSVDIPVDEEPKKSKHSISSKQERVVAAYNDLNEEEDVSLKTKPKRAIFADTQEAVEEIDTSAAEKVKMTAEETRAEIEGVAKEITSGITITEDECYKYPPISLLKEPSRENIGAVSSELDATAKRLVEVLHSFGVETRVINISRGPTVTRYELQPSVGVKISKITGLADDIALNLAAAGVRIEAPIPNKAAVGIEVPNKKSDTVCVREILESEVFKNAQSKITVALGRDIAGNPVVTDIAKMPHGLIAGATGSGKSVCINSIIMSILFKASPDEVKLLMIDPKVVELGIYNGIPHLLVPVVTDPRKASGALGWAVTEMERRYRLFADNNVRDLSGFNRLCELDADLVKLPQIVIIIDELADLMITAPGEVEDSINRIAAKARAAGMHLLIATQRPSVDVVTGVIKANIPTRIAFSVSSQTDSRTILDMGGAEKLLGRGDMLFNPVSASKPNRIQGCYVSDEEVEAVVNYIKNDHSSDYDTDIQSEIDRLAVVDKKGKHSESSSEDGDGEADTMLDEAIKVVVELGQASTSLLQRKLKLGYSRAARIMDQMEERGVIGPYEGAKPRQILITQADLMEKQASEE